MNWQEYNSRIIEKCKQNEIPYFASFEITPFCSFNCNMCYVRLDPDQAKAQGRLLTTQEWIKLASDAKKMGVLTLQVTGGEAFTRPDFSVLYETFVKMGFIIILRSNGYLLNEDLLKLFTKYKPFCLSITLYGASDETYKKVCGVSDGFSVVTQNIIKFKNAGINLRLSMTMTKENVDDWDSVREWASSNNLRIAAYGGLFTPIRNAKRSIDHLRLRYPDDECEIGYDIDDEPPIVTNRSYYMNPFWMCRNFGAMFCISWDGRMTLCNCMSSVWTEPLSGELSSAYHGLYESLRQIKRPKECESCKYIAYCSSCPSNLLSATGSPDKTNEEICRNARRKYKQFLKRQSNSGRESIIEEDNLTNNPEDMCN